MLIWAISNGCPCNEKTFSIVKQNGQMDVFEWMLDWIESEKCISNNEE